MLEYRKGPQPKALTEKQATPGATWDRSREIWSDLLRDQGHLCAYCQQRIAENGVNVMHVEHWKAQSLGDNPLEWKHLLAVCPGRIDNQPHCDTSRGNSPLRLHPVAGQGLSATEHLCYNYEGKITAKASQVSQEVTRDIETLGLNLPRLKRNRRAIYDSLKRELEKSEFSESSLRSK